MHYLENPHSPCHCIDKKHFMSTISYKCTGQVIDTIRQGASSQ